MLLDASIADVVERHVHDERLRTALHGQGVIGTFAGPARPGTAWIHAHHSLGLIGGWSFVEGGIGRVSFLLADAARDAGAVIAVDALGRRDQPRRGCPARRRHQPSAPTSSSATPIRCARSRCSTRAAPRAGSRSGGRALAHDQPGHQDQLRARTAPDVLGRAAATRRCTARRWRSARSIDHDASVVRGRRRAACPRPSGASSTSRPATTRRSRRRDSHTMSVFAQFVPYTLDTGTWDERRDEIADATLAAIARFAPDVADCVDRAAGARSARRRGAHRAHRRPHLPGRVPARPDVGPAVRAAHRRCRASTSAARPPTPEDR